jgi:hypothetical protein
MKNILRVTSSWLVISLFALPVLAQTNNSNYIFLLASGFLCDPKDASTCPATAKGSQGDSYEMSGAGIFDAQTKSVKATGTYTLKSSNGNVLESGVWLANELVSFDSYGIAPGALRQQGSALGRQTFGPKRPPSFSDPVPTGGLAVFRILLLPMSGPSKIAVLQVNCALGDVPRERSVEGIRLNVERNGGEFSEERGGRVMFLAMRPEVRPRAKSLQ